MCSGEVEDRKGGGAIDTVAGRLMYESGYMVEMISHSELDDSGKVDPVVRFGVTRVIDQAEE